MMTRTEGNAMDGSWLFFELDCFSMESIFARQILIATIQRKSEIKQSRLLFSYPPLR